MKNNLGFRAWFYFRNGWSTYFAFLFAAINTLTVTYFLAIERYPFLNEIFPTFIHYVVIVAVIAIPLLVLIGWAHFKRSAAFRSEADIGVESNPYFRRILMNTELMVPFHLKITELLIKLSKNEKLNESELDEISKLQTDLKNHLKFQNSYDNDKLGESTLSKLKKMDENQL
jgi:hypothetical protein|tara:strand:+ start:1526 stop:2041 length:516 start_codon:yes stop_codon:yes gene_type:complete